MSDVSDRPLSSDEIRHIALEQLGLVLTDREAEALRPVLNSLRAEVRRITPADRAGAEPDLAYVPEAWVP